METAVSLLQPNLDEIHEMLGANARRLDAFDSRLEQISAMESVAFDRLQLGLDAARLDNASLRAEQLNHKRNLEEVEVKLASLRKIMLIIKHTLQEDCNSIRTNQDSNSTRLSALEGIAAAIASSTDALLDLSEIQLHQGSQAEATLTAVTRSTDALLERSEIQLQRVAIPLGPDLALWTPEGYLLSPADDAATIVAVYEGRGRLEPGTVAVIRQILRVGDCYVDVGANIGLTLLPAIRELGAEGSAHAVEPSTRLQNLLHRSLVLNGISDCVTLHRCACGSMRGRAKLNLGAVHGHSSLLELPNAIGAEEVDVERLDDLIPPGQSIRLVKIDVEGFELEVLGGMTRILAENPDIALLAELGPSHLMRAGVAIDSWIQAFLGLGFTAYEIDERDGSLRPLRKIRALAKLFSLNLLFLRQSPNAYAELTFK
jgi:FkbM family methyltransferase